MTQVFSDYEAPAEEAHVQHVVSLESSEGKILLRPNRLDQGYKLADGAEGLGAGEVENEMTPRLGARGALLGQQREIESDMFLPIIIKSTSNTEVRRLVSQLTNVLKLADGTIQVVVENPVTNEKRYRDVAYRDGLDTPIWTSPTSLKIALTLEYADPWAYSKDQGEVTLFVAPGASGGAEIPMEFPVAFAVGGAVRDRYADNNGQRPAPVTLQFNGPMTDPSVSIPGLWTFALKGEILWDQYIVVNGKDRTIKIHSTTGARPRDAYTWVYGGSLFTDLVIPPGRHPMQFRAVDDTYTASMQATWPHTYQSMY